MTHQEKKIKNGAPFWWEKDSFRTNNVFRGKFRKLKSVRELLENLRKTS